MDLSLSSQQTHLLLLDILSLFFLLLFFIEKQGNWLIQILHITKERIL